MTADFVTLFPELVERYLGTSIAARAVAAGHLRSTVVDPRDFTRDKHRSCDDAPYGGGAGMVLSAEPLAAALDSIDARTRCVVYPTPVGARFTQAWAERIAEHADVVLVCGRYEGIDQRVIDEYRMVELSVGDYVLASGELAAMVITDAAMRLVDGVIRSASVEDESFRDDLLEYPQYTRPVVFRGREVPHVLLSGHHARIADWRREQRIIRTARRRPDLLETARLSAQERALADSVMAKESDDGCDQNGRGCSTESSGGPVSHR